jgi:hypothetical protein
MRTAEIEALLHAHGGRVRPVAFFHVLRQPKLEPDDHAFLLAHAGELGPADLLRWRSRCDKVARADVIAVLAEKATSDPTAFEHEVLGAPRLDLDDDDWKQLEALLAGKVPDRVQALVAARGGERLVHKAAGPYFSPARVESRELAPDDMPPIELGAAPWDALTTREIFDGLKRGHLAVDERTLAGIVMDRAKTGTEDWSSLVCEFPAGLADAVVEKARRASRGNERANLLAWLEAHGIARSALLSLALERAGGSASLALMSWIAKQLGSRAAWEKHGPDVVHRLLSEGCYADLADLATLAYSEASRAGDELPRGLVEAIQAGFALAFVRAAKDAITSKDTPRAMAFLSALACLDPPSRVSAAVHELTRLPDVTREVIELLSVNARLVKHSAATDASLEGIIAAVHVVVDALDAR